MKQTETLVEDIYRLMETKDADPSVDVEAEIEKYGENIKALMRTEFGREKRKDNRTLRLSNIGRTDKYLYNHRPTSSLCTDIWWRRCYFSLHVWQDTALLTNRRYVRWAVL